MKNIKKSLILVMAFAAVTFTFTACSKSANNEADDADGMEEVVDADATDVETTEAEVTTDSSSTDASTSTNSNISWYSGLDEWVLNGSGVKTITLEGIAGEGDDLSAEGQAQLDLIATILENNEAVNAVIKGHTPADQKIGNGKPRAVWTKAKLIIGHDAVGSRITTEGVGSNEPIEGVDANDPSQKRITVSFSK